MAEKEFTRICREILDLKTWLDKNYEKIIASKSDADFIKAKFLTFDEKTAQIKQIIARFESGEFSKRLDDVHALFDELAKLKDSLARIQSSGLINDESTSPLQVFSSQKVNALLDELKEAISKKLDSSADVMKRSEFELKFSNVENTTDLNKPISTATQEALDTKLGKDETASNSAKLAGKSLEQLQAGLNEANNALKQELITQIQSLKQELQKQSGTYKGVRLFKRLTSAAFACFYQEVLRDAKSNEIVKYGDIYYKGNLTTSAYNAYSLVNDHTHYTRVPLPYDEECEELLSNHGYYSGYTSFIAKMKDKPYIYVWGYNNYGQLGTGNTSNVVIPKKISFNANVKKVWSFMAETTSPYCYVWVLLENDELYCAGANGHGNLGIGTKVNSSVFVKHPLSGKDIVSVHTSGGYTNFVLTKAASGKSNKYDVYGFGHNAYGSLGVSGTDKVSPLLIASDIDSFLPDEYGCYPNSNGNSYHDSAIYIKEGIAYAAGIVDSMVSPNVSTAQRNKPYEAIKQSNGLAFENVKWAHIFNYRLGMLLLENGELYLNNVNDVANDMTGLDGVVKKGKYWQLYMRNVDSVTIISQLYYYCYLMLIKLKDGSYYYVSNAENNATFAASNLTLSNPSLTSVAGAYGGTSNTLVKISDAKLHLPQELNKDNLEFASYWLDANYNLLSSLFVTDGKQIYTTGSVNGANSHLYNNGGFTPLNLLCKQRS